MTEVPPLREIHLRGYSRWKSGKVRDIFDLGEAWLFVATDRVSAFDVILPDAIPNKGVLLTQVSRFWFGQTRHIVPNHVISFELGDLDIDDLERRQLEGRSMVVQKAERIDVECVVRSRLAGSGWEEYRRLGTLAGETLPRDLRPGDRLPELRFTPALKSDQGHDLNITVAALRGEVGRNLADLLEVTSLALFQHAESVADRAEFTIADTKFEFGFIDGHLTLIDEVLTPDSSRYWDQRSRKPGEAPQGFDKQIIRDSLLSSGWDREPPAPNLPPDVIESAQHRYAEVASRLQSTLQCETGATT